MQRDGHTVAAERLLPLADLSKLHRAGEPPSGWDLAVYDVSALSDFASIEPLEIASNQTPSIGASIALLGFQFEHENLAIHGGVISSKYIRCGVAYIQLDASVNHGNSGGPLLDASSGSVIGIVTRKGTGLTDRFDELIQSFNANHVAFSAVQGRASFGGLDFGKAMAVIQEQLGRTAAELQRSANVGIGYAYDVVRLRETLSAI